MLSNSRLFAMLVFVLFAQGAFAQACFDAAEEQVLDFSHPKDASDFFIAVQSDWAFASVDGVKTTYEKGTSELTIETGSIEATQSELPTKTNIIFSKYNTAANYEKLVEKTETTVNGFTAFFLEFKDLQLSIPDYGKAVVVWGDEAEGAKKYYLFTLRAKEANFENEKALFDKAISTFSLLELSECVEDVPDDTADGTPDDTGGDAQQDTGTDDTQDSGADSGSQDGSSSGTDNDSNPSTSFNTLNSDGSSVQAPQDNKIFGFDPIIVFGAAVVVVLVIVFFLILIAVIVALAYFAFFRKK